MLREAYKIIVDIDESELKKPTLKPILPVTCRCLTRLLAHLLQHQVEPTQHHQQWLELVFDS
ncbi:MAG UNVERIFIED_CONTAM: hypothetical protein LVR29_01725 [Microcystis novacekii LVE1205-3]